MTTLTTRRTDSAALAETLHSTSSLSSGPAIRDTSAIISTNESNALHPGRAHRLTAAAIKLHSERPQSLRKLSPGLAARMELLDSTNRKSRVVSSPTLGKDKIGRIPESQIRTLDDLHQYNSATITITKRGRAWSHSTSGIMEASLHDGASRSLSRGEEEVGGDSDQSSIISSGSRAALETRSSDEMERLHEERQKYRLPDLEKSLSNTQTEGLNHNASDHIEEAPVSTTAESPAASLRTARGEDVEPSQRDTSSDRDFDLNAFPSQRANSIYSLSRESLSNQLLQLTSLQLPPAESLSASISSISKSPAAARALNGAAEQIRKWIHKASEVLSGLDAEDDVEWAAAGGREGLSEVDRAIGRFEGLITVYVRSIEDLQSRKDISRVPANDLRAVVEQMEKTLKEWKQIRSSLRGVKEQVELAMEWEELWSVVLGDIGLEMDALSRLVFEMEEKRHKSSPGEGSGEASDGLDLGELETIVEETPINGIGRSARNNRFSLPPAYPPSSPARSPGPAFTQDDSSLLALFARMQPLRASLDFLPMRLSTFHARAEVRFPTACSELEARRKGLEKKWTKLESDAEALRSELGEDRWVLVFRNAGRQAQKMCESVGRSLSKLFEAVDSGAHQSNPTALAKRIENYEAKKMHYGPAIERVLGIIEKGVNDRLTVNGEILRLHSECKNRWQAMESQMREIDAALEELNLGRSQQLRDSISTIISMDQSAAGSVINTPGSSPASSVVMTGLDGVHSETFTSGLTSKMRSGSFGIENQARPNAGRRVFSMPTRSEVSNGLPLKTPTSRSSASNTGFTSRSASPSPGSNTVSITPIPSRRPLVFGNDYSRPRWSASPNTKDIIPDYISPYRQTPTLMRTPRTPSSHSSIPLPSPLGRERSYSPGPNSPSLTPTTSGNTFSSPLIPANKSAEQARPTSGAQALISQLSNAGRRRSLLVQPSVLQEEAEGSPSVRPRLPRPATAMASGRRNSSLPQPKARAVSGRDSILGSPRGMDFAGKEVEKERPRWR
ncbi:MAG: hypothetical protein M1827_006057 [Pycnora praestabilis]|nr:MAG: hypothetical protein M1827_006057 [Pycnora praestabilis]